jgi:hypothetical protein
MCAWVGVVAAFALAGCGLPPKMTLSDINPVRVYDTEKQPIFDQVRMYSQREDFRLERFEIESGSIIGHKRVLMSVQSLPGVEPAPTRQLIMHLRLKTLGPGKTEVNASFTFGDYRGTFSSEDENILVGQYLNLFATLDEAFVKR